MEVILLEDIRGLGRKNDIKKVSDGYARNFLIPRELAKPATAGEVKKIEAQKQEAAAATSETEEFLLKINQTTKKSPIGIAIKTGAGGEIFSSVSEKDILEKLLDTFPQARQLEVRVSSKKPIKELGRHTLQIDAGRGIKNTFEIEVVSSE